MGCDIHMYIQYTNKKYAEEDKAKGKEPWWQGFGGQINPGRNYGMFGTLAGVRYAPENEDKMFEPKGLPDFGLSWEAKDDLFLMIDDGPDACDEKTCTLEQAKRWGRPIINDSKGKPYKTYHPDWHSHSWLTVDEFAKALRWYKADSGYGPGVEWSTMLKTMRSLEAKGKNVVYVVFWFDN